MTEIQARVAIEGELFPDGKTVLGHDSLTWVEPLPVTVGFDHTGFIGKAYNLRRVGHEIHATMQLDDSWTERLKLNKIDDEFTISYSICPFKKEQGYYQTITEGRLREISLIPKEAASLLIVEEGGS